MKNFLDIDEHIEQNNKRLDFYYSNTNKQSWQKFIRDYKKEIQLRSEIVICKSGLSLIELGSSNGLLLLKDMKVDISTINTIESAINRKNTKLNLIKDTQRKDENNEGIKFMEIKASLQLQLPYYLNTKIVSLEDWCGIIKGLNNKNKAENEMQSKGRRIK